MFRIRGRFVEQHTVNINSDWWYECLECCLDQCEQLFLSVKAMLEANSTNIMDIVVGGTTTSGEERGNDG